jgi:hypothetical protein
MKTIIYILVYAFFLLALCQKVHAEDFIFKINNLRSEDLNLRKNSPDFSHLERVSFSDNKKKEFKLPSFISFKENLENCVKTYRGPTEWGVIKLPEIPDFIYEIVKISKRPALITIGTENIAPKQNNIADLFEFNRKNLFKVRGQRSFIIKIISISF